MAWEFEHAAGPYRGSIDGVVWDGETLLFSVPDESRIYRYDPRGGKPAIFREYTSRTAGLALDPEGNLYGCQTGSRRIVRFNRDGSTTPMEYRLDGHFHNYPDDLAIDRQGRIWFSDPYNRTPSRGPQIEPPLEHASVLRLERRADRSWQLRRMTFDTREPKGVLLSLDERALFVAESWNAEPEVRRELRAYPIQDDGTLGPYLVLLTLGVDHRGPHRGVDGMCLDVDGNIIACAGGSHSGPGPMIYVLSPSSGALEGHPGPTDRPRNCAFGDADLGTLYVGSDGGSLYGVRNTGHRGS